MVSTPSVIEFPPNHEVEKECIKLYFANLHLIYNFLDRPSFERRCQSEMWSTDSGSSPEQRSRSRRSRFPALYNAVVAIGALTGGDETLVDQCHGEVQAFAKRPLRRNSRSPSYGLLALASIYFAKAKVLLGDMFESCCLESQQTLFLMSIFCQYALRPHGCYMYSGMSARTALAIGSANEPNLKENPLEAVRTWWCMYYHEVEVCCSLGRETFLREPSYYPVFMAKFGEPMPKGFGRDDDDLLFYARSMTELAYILKRTSEDIYHNPTAKSLDLRSRSALVLDKLLISWKQQLAPRFDLDTTTLTEKESMTKRKVVLKLREGNRSGLCCDNLANYPSSGFYSARILIHRPFLISAAYSKVSSTLPSNVDFCLSAARETIHLLYDTFINRPFFRTWWYNTTYAFNAITIILYVLVSPLQPKNYDDLLSDVEKTLGIFRAMDGIAVARRCADLTEEIFEIAKNSIQNQRQQHQNALADPGAAAELFDLGGARPSLEDNEESRNGLPKVAHNEESSLDIVNDTFFSNIMDVNFFDNFDANLSVMNFNGSPFETLDLNWNAGGR